MKQALRGLTRRGRLFFAVGVLAAAVAILGGVADLLRVAVLLLALPILSLAIGLRSRVRLTTSRTIESHRVPVGATATVRLALRNTGRAPAGVLLVEDTLPYAFGGRPRFVLDNVWSRFRRELSYSVRSNVRGRYTIGPLTIRLTDPFGLVELRKPSSETGTLIVTPTVTPLPTVRLAGEWSGSGESRPRSIASAGEEDVTVRTYRHGDDIRRVHWPTTAHHGELMVRREEQPWQSRATLLLDTRIGGHTGHLGQIGHSHDSSLEWAVSATASIGVHLARRGYAIRLLTDAGGAVSGAWHDPGAGPIHAEAPLLEALAVVDASQSGSVGQWPDLLTGAGSATGLLVAVLGRLQPEEARLVAGLRHGSTAALAIMLDTSSWASVSAAAADAEQVRLTDAAQVLRRAGWGVALAERGDRIAEVWERLGERRMGPSGPPSPTRGIDGDGTDLEIVA